MLSSGTRIAVFMLVLLLAGTAAYWVFLADPGPDPFDILDDDEIAFLDADPDDMSDGIGRPLEPIDDRIVLGDSARRGSGDGLRERDAASDMEFTTGPGSGDAIIDDDDLRRLRDEAAFDGHDRERIVHPWDTMRRVASGGPIRVGGDGAGSSRSQPPIGDDSRDPDLGKGTAAFETPDESDRPDDSAQPTGSERAVEPPPADAPSRTPVVDEPARRTEPTPRDRSDAVWGEHVVQQGETVVAIAESWFGEPGHWDLVLRANPGVDPTRMAIGQRLRLPPRNWRPESPDPAPAPGGGGTIHEVRPTETLSVIARTHYGRAELWRVIYDANREIIGADPGRLKVGMRLRIPPAPTGT